MDAKWSQSGKKNIVDHNKIFHIGVAKIRQHLGYKISRYLHVYKM
jgi:hypothetical protein